MGVRERCLTVYFKHTTVLPAILAFGIAFSSAAQSFPQQSRVLKSSQALPSVSRVEPPNWWTGNPVNPVRLLIAGTGLTGARVVSTDPALRPGAARVTDGGRYVFVDLTIAPDATPGAHTLRIVTPQGVTEAEFDVDKPLASEGRFQGFTQDDVIYLVMVDRFADGDPSNDNPASAPGLCSRSNPQAYHGGDLQGIIDHLDYLKDLGVTAIWITPVYQNVNHPSGPETDPDHVHADYHGYGATKFYAVDPHFGDVAKLRELVDKAHAMGLKVIQDQVANHTGHFHPWLANPPTPTWYNGTVDDHSNNEWRIWSVTDPHGTTATRSTTLDGWFVNYLPDLDQNDPEVARYEIQNTLWWIDSSGIDGIREDTMPYVPRRFWQSWSADIAREHPRMDAVGEVYNGDAAVVAYFQGGRTEAGIDTGFGSLFDYPLFYQIRNAFAHNGSLTDLATTLSHDWLYPAPDHLVTFLGNHDNKRFMSEEGADVDGYKMAMTLLLTCRGIPELYYGDEIGMTGGNDPDNRHDFPGGFPGDTRSAFTADGRTAEENDVFNHVRSLTHLRAADAALRRGRMTCLSVADKQLVYARTLGKDSCLVAFNTDSQPSTIRIDRSEIPSDVVPMAMGEVSDRLGSGASATVSASTITLTIPARTGALFSMGTE